MAHGVKQRVEWVMLSTSGNGRATVLRFAQEGAQVLAVDNWLASAEETAAMVAQGGLGECVPFEADVTKEATLADTMAEARDRWGRIDVLHYNVGLSIAGRAARGDHRRGVRPHLRDQSARRGHGLQARHPDHARAGRGRDHHDLLARCLGAVSLRHVWGMSSQKIENFLGIPSVLVAIVATVLLIVSTVRYDDAISAILFWVVVVVGFLPALALITLNYGVVIAFQDRYGQKLKEFQDRLWELRKQT